MQSLTDLTWLPGWGVAVAAIVLSVAAALVVHRLLYGWLKRLGQRRGLLTRALVQRTHGPTRLAFIMAAVALTATIAPLPDGAAGPLRHIFLIALICLIGWGCLAALHVAAVVYSRRFKIDIADNLIARKHLTQVRILERTAAVFIVLLTMAAALMTLESVRQYGVTLLASAGAAGIIAGLALQPLLTNLIAGVQIAVTQPIRIDDAVIVENEWGWIEEITSTYVVVRLWDWRRMILPLTYFMQKPFQNWTRETASLIGSAMFYVDYFAPIDAMRSKLEEIAGASPLWDGDVVNLAVTDITERTLQVRCLISARNAGEAFDLRCEVREKMIAFLREEHPEALPQDRIQLAPLGEREGPAPERIRRPAPPPEARPQT
jgi:small-conductance mechanosensitive channel